MITADDRSGTKNVNRFRRGKQELKAYRLNKNKRKRRRNCDGGRSQGEYLMTSDKSDEKRSIDCVGGMRWPNISFFDFFSN